LEGGASPGRCSRWGAGSSRAANPLPARRAGLRGKARGAQPPRRGGAGPAPRFTGRRAAFGGKARLGRPLAGWGQSPPTGSPALPLCGGSRLLWREGGRGAERAEGKKERGLGPALGSPPSGAARWGAALARCCALPGVRSPPHPPFSVLAPSRAEPLAGVHRHPARRVHR